MSSNWFNKWQERLRAEEEEDEEDEEMEMHATQVMTTAATWLANNQLRPQPQWGGSVPGRKYIPRFRSRANDDLMQKYFVENTVYPPEIFRRRYRMRREVFLRLLDDVQSANLYFRQKRDNKGQLSFSPHVKLTCALQMMAYGQVADSLDENFMMAESTAIENFGEFCCTIVIIYQQRYLRAPNREDLERLLQ
ncbi:uncharacterized protein LOC112203265 [Rosa chinensis]|uniref:uncharacterized protein LOC112203265 n=1 Tax=Rosa chinensis TaxID=74649 RepID=UPI000D09718F|nr:uncharacterized protein LOC112203265 [Rosa chinensis]